MQRLNTAGDVLAVIGGNIELTTGEEYIDNFITEGAKIPMIIRNHLVTNIIRRYSVAPELTEEVIAQLLIGYCNLISRDFLYTKPENPSNEMYLVGFRFKDPNMVSYGQPIQFHTTMTHKQLSGLGYTHQEVSEVLSPRFNEVIPAPAGTNLASILLHKKTGPKPKPNAKTIAEEKRQSRLAAKRQEEIDEGIRHPDGTLIKRKKTGPTPNPEAAEIARQRALARKYAKLQADIKAGIRHPDGTLVNPRRTGPVANPNAKAIAEEKRKARLAAKRQAEIEAGIRHPDGTLVNPKRRGPSPKDLTPEEIAAKRERSRLAAKRQYERRRQAEIEAGIRRSDGTLVDDLRYSNAVEAPSEERIQARRKAACEAAKRQRQRKKQAEIDAGIRNPDGSLIKDKRFKS